MHTSEALLDTHRRAHRSVVALLLHCRSLSNEELNRNLPGFGYPSVREQLHHAIGAQRYWLGVLEGRMDLDDDLAAWPTIGSLETFRDQVFASVERYLGSASPGELNTPRPMMTWGAGERVLVPARVVMRTLMHFYHHQGQVQAMCRLMGKPGQGFDYPIT